MIQNSVPTPKQLQEIIAAGPDSIKAALGVSCESLHPLAQSLSLRDIAYACGIENTPLERRQGQNALSVMGFGMRTATFSNLVASGITQPMIGTYKEQAEHLEFSVPVSVENFQEVDLPSLDGDIDLEPLEDFSELTNFDGFLGSGAQKIKLHSFGRKFSISRLAIINNNLENFARKVTGTGAFAARMEAKMVAETLEANPQLDDGAAAFDADFLNTVSDAFSDTALGTALSYLRTQKTAAGQLVNLAGKYLIVEPALELAARELVHSLGLDLQVSVLAYLPTGRWYVTASPKIHPVVGVLRLAGAKQPIVVGGARPPEKSFSDGAFVSVVADLGACLLRRTGIVRGGTVTP